MALTKQIVMMVILCAGIIPPVFAAEFNPNHIDAGVHPILRLSGESMGGFQDALKSYILYTASQHIPGSKESGVGYYYNNKTRRMHRNLFYRVLARHRYNLFGKRVSCMIPTDEVLKRFIK